MNVKEGSQMQKVAALAGSANNSAKITNVSISGTIKTTFEGELPRLNEAIFDETSAPTVTDFSAAITVDKQSN